MNYSQSGVDTLKARNLIQKIKYSIEKTHRNSVAGKVIEGIGGFSGIFRPDKKYSDHDLVASTDGVGTKIDLCRKFSYLDPLAQDLIGMCVNDLYCTGATPAFFLDYISCGKLNNDWYIPLMQNISDACSKAKIALLGGETAEHPGIMKENEFDLSGFCVGFVSRKKRLPVKEKIKETDILVALPSSGLHSNGFSLIRFLLEKKKQEDISYYRKLVEDRHWLQNQLLCPTRIYTEIPDLISKVNVKAIAHITGGGIYENLSRVLPDDLIVFIQNRDCFRKNIFDWLAEFIELKELYHTFNMGMGMIFIMDSKNFKVFQSIMKEARQIGVIQKRTVSMNKDQAVFIQGIDTF